MDHKETWEKTYSRMYCDIQLSMHYKLVGVNSYMNLTRIRNKNNNTTTRQVPINDGRIVNASSMYYILYVH